MSWNPGLWTALALVAAAQPGDEAARPTPPAEIFRDVAAETGLGFVHWNGMTGELYFPEMNGAGVALFDFDNDGDLDVYLSQGHLLGEGKQRQDTIFPPEHPPPDRDRLYRNDLTVASDGRRTLRFTDVTEASRLDARGYGMGVAAGDVDNDGWTDLYLTSFGANQLWRNRGPGADGIVTFEDVTAAAGAGDERWSVPAAFFDFDADGWLDLFVANYVEYTLAAHKTCPTPTGRKDYCGPFAYRPEPDRLLRNRGDGTFEDVSASTGIRAAPGAALGVVTGDFDGDGQIDLYVANDQAPNHLWLGRRDEGGRVRFRNEALMTGTAVNGDGLAEASMGATAGDFDNDGDEDLFLSHLTRETNTLYRNDGDGFFDDHTGAGDLGTPSWEYTGFGTAWLDYDNDSWLDLLVVNGAVRILEPLARTGDPYPLHQKNQLFHNLAGRRFEDVSGRAGSVFGLSEVSRGAASGDLDNDGDTDVVVTNNSGPARLLLNQVGQDRPWLGLRLVGTEGRRDMLGAWVGVLRPGRKTLWRRMRTDGSYASSSDPRILVGLGDSAKASKVRVRWPGGELEEWPLTSTHQYLTLRQGTGKKP